MGIFNPNLVQRQEPTRGQCAFNLPFICIFCVHNKTPIHESQIFMKCIDSHLQGTSNTNWYTASICTIYQLWLALVMYIFYPTISYLDSSMECISWHYRSFWPSDKCQTLGNKYTGTSLRCIRWHHKDTTFPGLIFISHIHLVNR